MNKTATGLLLVVLIICLAAFACSFVGSNMRQDTTAPVISFDTEVLSLSVRDDGSILLKGVSASDRQDGDVTASVLVEGISSIREDHCATVTYAAFDQAGNVAKAQRTICYTDYESPRFSLSDPLIFRSGITVDLFRYVTATDLVDGDISDKIKASLVGGETSISQTGLHEVELRVTNSMGDTVRLTVPVEVLSSGYNASLKLSDYLIYLKKGDTFLPKYYPETLDTGVYSYDVAELSDSGLTLTIQSDVRTDACGTYTVTYTASYQGYTGYSRLIVVVED